jgi:hypothetical protein
VTEFFFQYLFLLNCQLFSMSNAAVPEMFFTVGAKRFRITVEEVVSTNLQPGTVVNVACGSGIVNDTDSEASDDEDEIVDNNPAVLLSTHGGMCTVCWLLDSKGQDIKLVKSRWPAHWKQANVFVLDTVHESVTQTAVTKHPSPEQMVIATRCYNSTSELVVKDTYSAVLVKKTAHFNN